MNVAPSQLIGKKVYDKDHHKVGEVSDLYAEEGSNEPSWATVTTGWFGSKESFVPLAITHLNGDEVEVEAPQDKIKHAPAIEHDSEISDQEEKLLYRYYGDIFESQGQATKDSEADSTAAPDNTMIRSEEELRV